MAVTHLRSVLGDERFEDLSAAGGSMTRGAMASYALEQIDHARARVDAKSPESH